MRNRKLSTILRNKPNSVTFFRLLLLFVAVLTFPYAPSTACVLFMISVILDYFDGIVARKYNQCSLFGECLDWLADITSSIIMFLWWHAAQPQLMVIFLILVVAELGFMIFDITARATHFTPTVKADKWLTYILRFTMEPGKTGYRCQGLGYINMINYYFCGVSRILYLLTKSRFWWWSFTINLIPAVSYTLMNIAYTENILSCWEEKNNKKGEIEVVFNYP